MAIEVIFFDLGDTLVTTAPKAWLPGAKDLLGKLKAKGIRLGIISNTANLATRAAILNLLPADFDITGFEASLVLFSSEVGIAKPKPEIFKKAINQAAIPGDRCLYCSENVVETLVAQHVGMRAVRLRPPPGGDLVLLTDHLTDFQNQV